MSNYLLTQTDAVNVRIDFSGRYALVTEHELNDTQVCTALEQMGGKGVTESVWTHAFLYADTRHKFLDVVEHRYARERLFQALTDEDKILITAFYGYSVTVGKIGLQFGNGTRGNGDKALLVALAGNTYELFLEVEIGQT